ncbi:MAG: hypothetical protein JWL59_1845 [Chthoniobacteraceae bacterium]|nr:hypothetical protein [Chthoniobacteraceae bacterium]
MPEFKQAVQSPGINLKDILSAIFKHRWKVLICTLAGVAAAAVVFVLQPPLYESQAKLLVRYVVDRSAIDPVESAAAAPAPGRFSDTQIDSEVEILTSQDLTMQVAEAIGYPKLVARTGLPATKGAAASIVAGGLTVTARKGSNVINVSYKNRDPELSTLVLDEFVNRYFTKHLEVHRSAGAFDFVTQQTDQVRAGLNQTEEELKRLKAKAGVISLVDSTAALTKEMARTQEELHGVTSELAEQQARVQALEKMAFGDAKTEADTKPVTPVSSDKGDVQQYQALVARLSQLHASELELLAKFTPENRLVKSTQSQIQELEGQRRDLEKKFPNLLTVPTNGTPQGRTTDVGLERAKLMGIQAKAETLKLRLADVQKQFEQFSDIAPQIAKLERKKEVEETNFKYFGQSLEKARIDEALDPSKIPNISVVQKPSSVGTNTVKRNKIMAGLIAGALALGLSLPLLLELVMDHTIKRAEDLENGLRIPVLLSIPYAIGKGRKRTRRAQKGEGSELALQNAGGSQIASWEPAHFIRPFAEAIRDRLGLYFDITGVTHKPKLVAVTGFSDGAGSSTLAAGLAASLSETDTGKVLLVDMNMDPAQFHAFFDGKPANSLEAALQGAAALTPSADNLYLAAAGSQSAGPLKLGLKKFHDMMPQFKASDFDYIIFDMPPVSPTSPTLSIARFMDKVLVVLEAGKTDQATVKRDYGALVESGADVSAIFNKERTYSPKWITG